MKRKRCAAHLLKVCNCSHLIVQSIILYYQSLVAAKIVWAASPAPPSEKSGAEIASAGGHSNRS